jgi:hypothetical protein
MAVIGVLTNEGIVEALAAEANQGFEIRPTSFGVSATKGALVQTRGIADINAEWFSAAISTFTIIGTDVLEAELVIPPGENGGVPIDVGEIYLKALDQATNPFLLILAQPDLGSTPLTYDPDGQLKIRVQIQLTNVNLANNFNFIFSQAQEIAAHDNNEFTHHTNKGPFTIDNDTIGGAGVTNIAGLLFNNVVSKAARFDYFIRRKTDTQIVIEYGQAFVWYDDIGAVWAAEFTSNNGNDAGAILDIDAATGQMTYNSDDFTGANYESSMDVYHIKHILL